MNLARVLFGLILLLAGCGSEPALMPTVTPQPTASARPTSTPQPTAAPTATAGAGVTAAPGARATEAAEIATIEAFNATQKPQVTAANGNVNLRQGPGTDYAVVGTLTKGESLEVIGRNADSSWWQVSAPVGAAWVAASVVSAPHTENVPEASLTPAPTPSPTLRPTLPPPAPTATRKPLPTSAPRQAPAPAACCKVCGSTSKACGDSCISNNKTCHKGPGCACD